MPTANPVVELLDFSRLLHRLQAVRRDVDVPGENRKENDAEHSFQLAMLCWFVADHSAPELDRRKVLEYALVHDLVEAYAGDTQFDSGTPEPEKAEREQAAFDRIRQEFPEQTGMHQRIADYERREDPESRFVYSMDKIAPFLAVMLDNGAWWQRKGMGLEELMRLKEGKANLSPEATPYYDDICAYLKEHAEQYFPPQ